MNIHIEPKSLLKWLGIAFVHLVLAIVAQLTAIALIIGFCKLSLTNLSGS